MDYIVFYVFAGAVAVFCIGQAWLRRRFRQKLATCSYTETRVRVVKVHFTDTTPQYEIIDPYGDMMILVDHPWLLAVRVDRNILTGDQARLCTYTSPQGKTVLRHLKPCIP